MSRLLYLSASRLQMRGGMLGCGHGSASDVPVDGSKCRWHSWEDGEITLDSFILVLLHYLSKKFTSIFSDSS
jgi:hypothetical protein